MVCFLKVVAVISLRITSDVSLFKQSPLHQTNWIQVHEVSQDTKENDSELKLLVDLFDK